MKKFILSVCLLVIFPPWVRADFFDGFRAEKINRNTYVIHGPMQLPSAENKGFMNNPAFIVAEHSVIVIDPGSSQQIGQMVLREIARVTDRPVSHIFNTHIHGDHWLANEIIQRRYPSVKIIADPRMIKKAHDGAAQQWIDTMLSMTDGATAGTKIAYPKIALTDGAEIKAAGLNFKIHSVGIAHSNTDIMIEYVDGSVLFTGDNAANHRILRMDDGSFRDSIKAMDRAMGLELKYYVPGHGKTGDIHIVKNQRQYFATLYRLVMAYYEDGLEDFEMKARIAPALKKYADWAGFDEQLGKHISLARMEVEAAEFE